MTEFIVLGAVVAAALVLGAAVIFVAVAMVLDVTASEDEAGPPPVDNSPARLP